MGRFMPDYKLKSEILKEGQMLYDYNRVSKSVYSFVYDREFPNALQYSTALELSAYYRENNPIKWKECERISHAHCSRVVRLKKKISEMVFNSDCVFLTFTFTDYSLQHNNERSRRKAVTSFLNDLNVPYVANIDFGKKNHREHYHAVVAVDKVDYSKWTYGAINGQIIRNNTDDIARLSKYVAKLTNHAIKETTKRNAAIYSRKKFAFINGKYIEVDKNGIIKNEE